MCVSVKHCEETRANDRFMSSIGFDRSIEPNIIACMSAQAAKNAVTSVVHTNAAWARDNFNSTLPAQVYAF